MQFPNHIRAISLAFAASTAILLFSTPQSHAASTDCNTLNTSTYSADANGSFTVNNNQFFELTAGEKISFSANVPAGTKVTVKFAGQNVVLDNTAGTAARVLQGNITVSGATGPTETDNIGVDVEGLSPGDNVTVNFDCVDGVPAPAPPAPPAPAPDPVIPPAPTGITGGQVGATADDLISAVFDPVPAPNGFAGLLTPERIGRAQAEIDKEKEEDLDDRLERLGAEIRRRSKIECASLHAQIAASRAEEERLGAIADSIFESEEQKNPGISISTLFEIPAVREASDRSDRQNIDITVPLVNKLGACEDRIEAQVAAEFRRNSYVPDAPQTSTKRFEAVINPGRFNGADINPTNDGNGFAGKFYIGDNSGERPWVVFLNTSGTFTGDNRKDADRSTQAWSVALGAQLRVDPQTLLGISGTYKNATAKSKATDSKLDGDYFSVAVSADRNLGGNAALSLSASYTHGQNDLSVGNSIGSFDLEALSASASLSNSVDLNELTLSTSLNAAINQIKRDAYTDSNALFVPGSQTTSANFSANASLSRTFEDIGGFDTITPSIGIAANYNHREKLIANLVNGVEAKQLGLGATLSSGIDFKFRNGPSANISASYGLFQDDVQNWAVNGALVFPLN